MKSCLLADHIPDIFFQLFDPCCSPSILPDDCRIKRFACHFIPDDNRLSLIVDSHAFDLFSCHMGFFHHLFCRFFYLRQDFFRIVFHPARLRIILFMFFMWRSGQIPVFIQQEYRCPGRSLINSHKVFPAQRFPSLPSWYAESFSVFLLYLLYHTDLENYIHDFYKNCSCVCAILHIKFVIFM